VGPHPASFTPATAITPEPQVPPHISGAPQQVGREVATAAAHLCCPHGHVTLCTEKPLLGVPILKCWVTFYQGSLILHHLLMCLQNLSQGRLAAVSLKEGQPLPLPQAPQHDWGWGEGCPLEAPRWELTLCFLFQRNHHVFASDLLPRPQGSYLQLAHAGPG
jgi:hypothetical protein